MRLLFKTERSCAASSRIDDILSDHTHTFSEVSPESRDNERRYPLRNLLDTIDQKNRHRSGLIRQLLQRNRAALGIPSVARLMIVDLARSNSAVSSCDSL
jgi:hypothetical protein